MGGPKHNSNQTWWIPITYTALEHRLISSFESTINGGFWLHSHEYELGLFDVESDMPVVFNIQYSGYYITNYDANNWKMLAKALMSDHKEIHVNNRFQMIHDSYMLAKHGYLPDYSILIQIVEYLDKETEYMPLYMAKEILGDKDIGVTLRTKLQRMFQNQYERVGTKLFENNTWSQDMTQSVIVAAACSVKDGKCYRDAKDLVEENMKCSQQNSGNCPQSINKNIRQQIMSAVNRHDCGIFGNYITSLMETADDAHIRKEMTEAMCVCNDPEILTNFLLKYGTKEMENNIELIDLMRENDFFKEALDTLLKDDKLAQDQKEKFRSLSKPDMRKP